MLRPFLLVGVGGSGGKTLRALKVALERRLKAADWDQPDLPAAWQFLHIDTPVTQDGTSFPAPFLTNEEYLGIVPPAMSYAPLIQNLTGSAFGTRVSPTDLEMFAGWIPSPAEVKVPVHMGAGQFRAIGRALTVSRLDAVRTKVLGAMSNLNGAAAVGELTELSQALGHGGKVVSEPMVLVISSIAGGSGAGAYLDVVEAIKSCSAEPWARRVVAWLYTPDVFKGIDGAGGVAPNSLAVLAETMAGSWSPAVSSGTRSLYQTKGVIPPNGHGINVGPAYTFLIGRKNNSADFGSQDNVYFASSSSLAAFMTNPLAQDNFWGYYITNLDGNANSEAKLPDRSQLKVSNLQRPAFLAMGFGRLSMGRDRFRDFASQRLTRDLIERLLDGHQRDLDESDRRDKTSDDLIQQACDEQWDHFLDGSKLAERNPKNDVVDALTPSDRSTRALNYRVTMGNATGVGANGTSAATWTTKLVAVYAAHKQAFLDEDAVARNALGRKFVAAVADHLPYHASDYAVRVGLPATIRLLVRLSEELSFNITELDAEIAEKRHKVAGLQARLAGVLSEPGMASLPPKHPAVEKALNGVRKYLEIEAQLATLELAKELVEEVNRNVVVPLQRAFVDGHDALRESYRADQLVNGGRNPALDWPDPRVSTVSQKFEPPPNERVLLPLGEYVDSYDALVRESVPSEQRGSERNNEFYVARKVGLGALETSADGSTSNLDYKFVETSQDWVPRNTAVRPPAASASQPSAAKYRLLSDALKYVDRADQWMTQPDSAFGDFVSQSLLDYLGEGAAPDAELRDRRTRFLTEFGAALSASRPLIDINVGIAAAIHPGVNCSDAANTISPIPFDPDSDFGKAIIEKMPADPNRPPRDRFGSAPRAQDITIDAFLSNPMQPMVFNSIMQPIASQWAKESTTPAARAGFYQWRRARPLQESIPAAPQQVSAMIRGWLLADIFGQIRVSTDNAELGTKIDIWDPTHGYVAFPYPLLHPGTPQPNEYVGVVLESLSIALVACNSNSANAVAPLHAYHRLLDLGGPTAGQASLELTHWVSHGRLPAGAEGLSDRAKSLPGSTSDPRMRSEFLTEQIELRRKNFEDVKRKIDDSGDIYGVSRAWEVHELRIGAMAELQKIISELGTEDQMM